MESGDAEQEILREVEEILRGFVCQFDEQTRASQTRGQVFQTFAPITVEMVGTLKLAFTRLDAARTERVSAE